MRARIAAQWQINYDEYKIKVNHKEPGSAPKSTETRGLESNLAMTKHGQSGSVPSHFSDSVHGRRAPNIGQALNVATYNVRTLADTTVIPTEASGIKSSKLSSPYRNIDSLQPSPSTIYD